MPPIVNTGYALNARPRSVAWTVHRRDHYEHECAV